MKFLIGIIFLATLLAISSLSFASDIRTITGKVTGIRINDFHNEGDITDPRLRDLEKIAYIHLNNQSNQVYEIKIYKLTAIPVSQRDHFSLINLIHENALDLLRDAKEKGWTITIDYDFIQGNVIGEISRIEISH